MFGVNWVRKEIFFTAVFDTFEKDLAKYCLKSPWPVSGRRKKSNLFRLYCPAVIPLPSPLKQFLYFLKRITGFEFSNYTDNWLKMS